MRNFVKLTIIAAFILSVVFFVTISKQSVSNVSAKDDKAKILFLQNCARCHGADGKANTEIGKEVKAPDLTNKKVGKKKDDKLAKKITSGKGSMPAFNKILSKEEIDGLVIYVKSLSQNPTK